MGTTRDRGVEEEGGGFVMMQGVWTMRSRVERSCTECTRVGVAMIELARRCLVIKRSEITRGCDCGYWIGSESPYRVLNDAANVNAEGDKFVN